MSGLCGWLAANGGASAESGHQDLLERMAAPLRRFDQSELAAATGRGSAAAIAARPSGANIHQQEGLLVAIWGHARLAEPDGASHPGIAGRLAELWRAGGSGACAALTGPFALCILDESAGEALLAIDRSGTHALSYACNASGLYFASSADSLAIHPAVESAIDPQALYNYLYFHMVPAPRTIYRHQQRLLPGEYLHWKLNGAGAGAPAAATIGTAYAPVVFANSSGSGGEQALSEVESTATTQAAVPRGSTRKRAKYWQIAFEEGASTPFEALKREFLATLRHAVEDSTRNCDPGEIGAFLSGGTDSSTLACILGQVTGRPARTYSIGFDAPGYDEMEYARIAARHFGTEHHELYVSPADVVDAIPKIAAVADQPFGNASAVPAYYCARMARADGITRLLGGDGGDELFGGNERYARQAVFARYGRVPSTLRQVLIEPLLFGAAAKARLKWLDKARSYIVQASVPMPARLETYNLLQRYGDGQVFEPSVLASVDRGEPQASMNETYWLSDCDSQINRMLALDMKFTLADNDLPKVSKACELAGVEAAFPFLNDAMVQFSARLAPEHKLRGTRLRYLFKQALSDTLPRAILRKQKHGFGLPFGLWLQQDPQLRQLAFDSLSDLKARRIVRAEFVDELLGRHVAEHPAYHGTMVWMLMMLEQWHKQRAIPV